MKYRRARNIMLNSPQWLQNNHKCLIFTIHMSIFQINTKILGCSVQQYQIVLLCQPYETEFLLHTYV